MSFVRIIQESCPVVTRIINLTPRARYPKFGNYKKTIICHDDTLGANCTIVCGHEVGHHATIATGAVVAANVQPHALMAGTRLAKQIG